ncbi:MAG TPA: hypothetical protein VMR06_04690 [Dokdonella sp.]|uniref:hypothetical protein n=1 Tax=Dokdonella sp. TaxID=2291710 RepID=UPI002C7F220F|nr:hypothetical protein [Dokdonella sp.]HUD41277.1 hypothetical protein [Dokdonella sp.]
MSRRHAAAIALVLAATVCAASPAGAQSQANAPPDGVARSIELICGGGFSGASGGRRIDGAGRLWQVRQPLGAPRVEQPLGDDAGALRRWHAWLDAADFERLSHRKPGNISCTLSRTGSGGTHRITWSGSAPPATLPAPVIAMVGELRAWAPPAADGETAVNGAAPPSEAAPPSMRSGR